MDGTVPGIHPDVWVADVDARTWRELGGGIVGQDRGGDGQRGESGDATDEGQANDAKGRRWVIRTLATVASISLLTAGLW